MIIISALLVLAAASVLVVVFQTIRIGRLIWAGHELATNARPFSRPQPGATRSIAIVGDSTAYGTGANRPERSVAGLIAAAYPDANVINLSKNGARITEVLRHFDLASLGRPTAILLLIGGNDVLHRTPSAEVERDLSALLDLLKRQTLGLIVMLPGNFRTAPIFPWPVNAYYQRQSLRIRAILKRTTAVRGVPFIDIYRPRFSDPFSDVKHYYAADGFHPSSVGYANWFLFIKPVLDERLTRATA